MGVPQCCVLTVIPGGAENKQPLGLMPPVFAWQSLVLATAWEEQCYVCLASRGWWVSQHVSTFLLTKASLIGLPNVLDAE